MIILSFWTTTGKETAPALMSAYPGVSFSLLGGAPPGRGAFSVPNPPAALLADSRFPAVSDFPVQVADYQAAMLAALNNWYAAKIAAGFVFNGVTYPLDIESRQAWHGVLTLTSNLTFPLLITSADGKTVTSMTKATALSAAAAALTSFVATSQAAAAYRQRISAATTAAALDAIVFS
jgi:6,7-dimethyl-8-ribityllumazine synthase